MFALAVPAWVLWASAGYAVLSAAATAMDPNDKTLYGFLRRFLQALTFSARSELTQLHIPLPEVALPQVIAPIPPTQADAVIPSAVPNSPNLNQ